jgi:hypothetical protein
MVMGGGGGGGACVSVAVILIYYSAMAYARTPVGPGTGHRVSAQASPSGGQWCHVPRQR